MSTLACVISVAVGIGVFMSQKAKKRSLNRVKECTYRQMTLKFRRIKVVEIKTESGKFLFVQSGIHKSLASIARNLGLWNP